MTSRHFPFASRAHAGIVALAIACAGMLAACGGGGGSGASSGTWTVFSCDYGVYDTPRNATGYALAVRD